jgi:outer membrane immunogenic protein
MKTFLLGAVGLVALGLAAPATAADLAARPYTKAPGPMMAAIYDWSGFYIGANGGWGSSRKCWDAATFGIVSIGDEGCHDATGGVAGGQIGYRWQSSAWGLRRKAIGRTFADPT